MFRPHGHERGVAFRPPHEARRPLVEGGTLRNRTVLLAMNGQPEAAAAARVASSLAAVRGIDPVVVRAYYPGPALVPPVPHLVSAPSPADAARDGVREDLLRASGGAEHWPIVMVGGAPSEVITATAHELGAAMILMGLHAHGMIQRTLGGETALQVMRHADVPVLATTPSIQGVPTRIVVGVDFGSAGLRAARVALALLADGGTLDLAFVDRPAYPPSDEAEGDEVIHREGVAAAFTYLRGQLAAPMDVCVTTTVLEGAPSEALRELAAITNADIIAVGSRRHGFVDRMLLGSVTADLVHNGQRSLLVVPPGHG
jgi:nucleotide-binding universal stress UspA family protein